MQFKANTGIPGIRAYVAILKKEHEMIQQRKVAELRASMRILGVVIDTLQ